MLYNEHGWPGSGPGPVVSIGWMNRVLNYTITRVPRNKVVAAVSVFGFDFNLTTGRNTYVTYAGAIEIAKRYGKDIIFDEETKRLCLVMWMKMVIIMKFGLKMLRVYTQRQN